MALRVPKGAAARAAVFLDKDGTLLEDVPYNADPVAMRWAPGARAGVRALAQSGRVLVVVSNQAGMALGRFGWAELLVMVHHLYVLFGQAGARLDGFYFCPHHPHGHVASFTRACSCRKPAPGLLLQAAEDLELDLARSWMIGDILDDVEAGHRAGCRSILLDVGHETEWKKGPARVPEWRVQTLEEAARRLCALQGDRHASI